MTSLDSARHSVDAVKGITSDTNIKDTDSHDLKPLEELERQGTYGPWYLRAGGRLSRTLSRQFALALDDDLYEEFAEEWGRRRVGSRRNKRILSAAVVAVLLALVAALAAR